MSICFRPILLLPFLALTLPAVQAQTTNSEPDCSEAVANPAALWPPNHKYRVITIDEVTDPDDDELDIVIDCIMQDEPLNATGDGNTAIDGRGLGEAEAEVRSERRGNRNGRFYHIGFTATDPDGASCTGVVPVSVAHDRPSEPVDEGPLFQSTEQPGEDCGSVLGNNDPIIISEPVIQVQELEEYQYPVQASDPDDDPLTFSLIEAPESMSIESVIGLITWTPQSDQAGDHTVTVKVDDGNGGTDTQTFTVTVDPAPGNTPPTITSNPVTETLVGLPYQYPVTATDPDPDDVLTFSLTEAPAGMTIDPQTGVIEWIPGPQQTGDTAVTIQVDDGNGGTDTQSFTVTVWEVGS